MTNLNLLTTPFHERTAALAEGQAWRRWAGHAVLGSYHLGHEREYAAIRNAAALIDVSPLHKYHVSGPDAARMLDKVVPRDLARCRVGQVMYTPWCDGRGKVIDDGTISRLAEDTFRVTSADPSLRWFTLNASGLRVAIEDVSYTMAALALQGPRSRAVLELAAAAPVRELPFFRFTTGTIAGVPVTISRTGYTGDLGYEIWLPAERALTVWDALMGAGHDHGLLPAGILALDVARIEAGLLMNEVDYVSSHRALIDSQLSTPYELGLGWAVALAKGPFNGRRALLAERAAGSAWAFVGLEVDWDSLTELYAAVHLPPRLPRTAWRASTPVYSGGVQVGYATSGCWSPILKASVALAHVEARYATPGTHVDLEVTVEHRRRRAAARVARLPFFDPKRKKSPVDDH